MDPRHRIVDPTDAEGRERLVTEVWGPAGFRREKRALAKAGKSGAATGGVGSLLDGCSCADVLGFGDTLGELLFGVLAAIVVALVFVAVVWLVLRVRAWIGTKDDALEPQGAIEPTAARRRFTGRIVRGAEILPPKLAGASRGAIAWAVELHAQPAQDSSLMLRDGETLGFDVEIDGGGLLRVRPGPVGLLRGDSTAIRLTEGERTHGAVLAHVTQVDPRARAGDPEPAIPFDRYAAQSFEPGDRIVVEAPVEETLDPDGEGYRHVPRTLLVTRGLPLLDATTRAKPTPPRAWID